MSQRNALQLQRQNLDGTDSYLTSSTSREWVTDRLARIQEYWNLGDFERVQQHTKILANVMDSKIIPYKIFYEN